MVDKIKCWIDIFLSWSHEYKTDLIDCPALAYSKVHMLTTKLIKVVLLNTEAVIRATSIYIDFWTRKLILILNTFVLSGLNSIQHISL